MTANFFGTVVEHTVAEQGQSVVLDGRSSIALPLPPEVPFIARIHWRGPATVLIEEADGTSHLLEREGRVRLDLDPIEIEFRLDPRYPLLRLPQTRAFMAALQGFVLLTVPVLVLGLLPAQLGAVNTAWCASWVGDALPPEHIPLVRDVMKACHPPQQSHTQGDAIPQDRMAEYLERILRNQIDKDEGTRRLERGDRQHGERKVDDFYMPAGDDGPKSRMGGASETALRPERHPGRTKKEEPPPEDQPPEPEVLAVDQGTPIERVEPEPTIVPVPDDPPPDETLPEVDRTQEERAEDREGWGIRDWYDQAQLDEDQERIKVMTDLAKRMLKIDPDDPNALSLLAFYQYLNEDHKGAIKTYDRLIELFPNSAAAYNNKALAYKRLGQYQEEENLYHLALQIQPDDYTALNNLAVNLAHQKRHDEALQIMEDLERRKPNEAYANLHRAKIFAEMGDDERALHYLELSLKGMAELGTMHSIEFRQDIRVDPSFDELRKTRRFKQLLWQYYGDDSPLPTD
ncbi:MAG: hypothetical protein EA397_04885 [Deltaproteobacteria bacterium]|nr:MAG: hypothetical protein EA397_04885 [Deltaproteobacteria bacterium]